LEKLEEDSRRKAMQNTMNMVYWKGEQFWVGKLLDHPEIMSQGESIEELETNLREAYLLMAMDDVPEEYSIKPITI
jgi:predicted RNase H-like HicB family nuclease